MTEPTIINKRFNGPPDSGNGGYSSGRLAGFIEGSSRVRLSVPPPLDTPMTVRLNEDKVELMHAQQLVATACPARVDIEVPKAPDYRAAQAASARYRGFDSHFYPRCFVCGPEREAGDGLRVFPGPLEGHTGPEGMVAAAWVPHENLADSTGKVSSEYIWSVLDCPGAYSFAEPETGTVLLGELSVAIHHSVSPGEKCVLTGWQISHRGRKHFTGTALFDEAGRCCAVGYATWFEVMGSRECSQ